MTEQHRAIREQANEFYSPENVEATKRRNQAAMAIESQVEPPAPVVDNNGVFSSLEEAIKRKDTAGLGKFRLDPTARQGVSRAIGVDADGQEWIIGTIVEGEAPTSEDGSVSGAPAEEDPEEAQRLPVLDIKAPPLTPDMDILDMTKVIEDQALKVEKREQPPEPEPSLLRQVETTLNAPFSGLTRGVAKAGANALSFTGILEQEDVDQFFGQLDQISEMATEGVPAADALDATGEIAGNYIVPAAAAIGPLTAMGASPLLAAAISELGVGAIATSPNEGNVFNMIPEDSEAFGLVRDLLATSPDDPEWMNRSRNAVEAMVGLGIGEAAARGAIKAIDQSKRLVESSAFQSMLDQIDAADAQLKEKAKGGTMGAGVDPTDALALLKPLADAMRSGRKSDLMDVLRLRSEQMQLPPKDRVQPSGDEMFDTSPEAYERNLPEQIETEVPRTDTSGPMPKKDRTRPLIDKADEIAEVLARNARPHVGTNVQYFYHPGPIIDKAIELGIPRAQAENAVAEFMLLYAATSPRTQTLPNLLSAALVRAKNAAGIKFDDIVGPGKDMPGINEHGYPMIIQKKGEAGQTTDGTHRKLLEALERDGKIDYRTNPKPYTFAENLRGNLNGVTVDTHAIRAAINALNEVDPGSVPRQWFGTQASYDAYVKDPSILPSLLQKKPVQGGIDDSLASKAVAGQDYQVEYAVFSDIYRKVAEKLGVHPAEAQSLSWFANGKVTGLASAPKTVVELINDRIDVTAQLLGKTKEEVFEGFMLGRTPLLTAAGAMIGAGSFVAPDQAEANTPPEGIPADLLAEGDEVQVASLAGRLADMLKGSEDLTRKALPDADLKKLRNAVEMSGKIDADLLSEFNYNQWSDPKEIDMLFSELVDLGKDRASLYKAAPGKEARRQMQQTLDEIAVVEKEADAAFQAGRMSRQDYDAFMSDLRTQKADTARRLDESERKSRLSPEVQTAEDREWLAARLNMQPEDLADFGVGKPMNSIEITATKVMLEGMMKKFRKLHAKTVAAPTEENVVEMRRLAMVMAATLLKFKGAATEAGRTLNALRGVAKTPVAREQEISNLYKLADNGTTNEAFLAAVTDILQNPDDVALFRFMEKQRKVTTKDMMFEAWINSLLGSPQTHVVNIISNAMLNNLLVADRYGAALVGSVRRGIAGNAGTKQGAAGVTMDEAVQYHMAQFGAAWEAVQVFTRTLRSGQGTDVMQKITPEFQPAITAQNIREAWGLSPRVLRDGGIPARVVDGLGEYYFRGPSRLLQAADEAFKINAYRQEIYAQAVREIANNPQWTRAEAGRRFAEIITDPEINAPHIHIRAIDQARAATLTSPPGEIGQLAAKLRAKVPFAKVVLPFFGVINNIVKTTFAHLPIPSPTAIRTLRDPRVPAAEKDEILGRYAVGATLLAGFAGMASQGGFISGRMSDDPKTLQLLENQGRAQYSIFIPGGNAVANALGVPENGQWVSYERTAPVGAIIAIAADVGQALAYMDDPVERDNLALAAVAAVAPFLMDQSVMTGIRDVFDAIDPTFAAGEDRIERMGSFIGDLAATTPGMVAGPLAPGTPLSGAIARAVDPTRRSARPDKTEGPEMRVLQRMLRKIYSRTPGLSSTLPAYRNVWGEEVFYGSAGPDFFSPIWSQKAAWDWSRLSDIEGIPDRAADPNGSFYGMEVGEELTRSGYIKWLNVVGVDGELERLGMPLSRPGKNIQSEKLTEEQWQELVFLAGKGVTVSGDMIDIRAEDSTGRPLLAEFDRVPKSVRDLSAELGLQPGKSYTQKQMLDAIVRSPWYQNYLDGIDTEGGEGIDTKVEVLTAVHNFYNDLARKAARAKYLDLDGRLKRKQMEAEMLR